MAELTLIAVVATIFALAYAWARALIRHRPYSPAGIVMSAIDTRILGTGAAIGASVTLMYWAARTVQPWLGWGWLDSVLGEVIVSAPYDTVAFTFLVIVVLITLVVPVVAVVGLTPCLLLLSMAGAHWRMHRAPARPALMATLTTVILVAIGGPIVLAILYGVTTEVASRVLRRGNPPQHVPVSHPENLGGTELSTKIEHDGRKQARELADLRDQLPRVEQYRAARIAAFHFSVFAGLFTTMALGAPFGY